MAFQKGQPRHPNAGRKKGTPNKESKNAADIAERLGVDPFEILIRFAAGDWKGLGYENEVYHREDPEGSTTMGYVITPELRQKAAKDASEYLYPKRKALELSGQGEDAAIEVVIKDYGSKT